MLVLSRKAGESLVIGDGITVTVQSVKGDVVRIAIDAPRQVPILRGELVPRARSTARPWARRTAPCRPCAPGWAPTKTPRPKSNHGICRRLRQRAWAQAGGLYIAPPRYGAGAGHSARAGNGLSAITLSVRPKAHTTFQGGKKMIIQHNIPALNSYNKLTSTTTP